MDAISALPAGLIFALVVTKWGYDAVSRKKNGDGTLHAVTELSKRIDALQEGQKEIREKLDKILEV